MSEATRIGVVGCAGRMGQMNLRVIQADERAVIAGGTERAGSPALGQDIGGLIGGPELGLAVGDDPRALFAAADVVVDFTTPETSLAHAALAAETGTALIIGTTGLDGGQEATVAEAASRAAIFRAANMSLGVTLLLSLIEQAASALDPAFDIEVLEMHHHHKVDAPSGTALALGQAAAAGRGVALEAVAQKVRDGITGPRRSGDIGFATLRGGNVAGEHTVIFAGESERIELTHKANDRVIFARGALTAALWLAGKPAGLYSMKDVLGLS